MKLKDLYNDAISNKYAIGAYNFYNYETLKAIIDGAENSSSPVIAAVSESAMKYLGSNLTLMSLFKSLKTQTKQNVYLHLDHGKTFEICAKCVDLGFDSVMIDGSSLSFEENIKLTKKVVDYAHKRNVYVEGELGVLAGVEDDVKSEANIYTNPDDALEFVKRTNVDSLAIAIGTSHGAYKFSGIPALRIDILEEIEKALPSFPLVLHGASSVPETVVKTFNEFGGELSSVKGVPEEILSEVSKHNIVKINVDTDLRLSFTSEVRKALKENSKLFSPRDYLSLATKKMTELVISKQKIFGASK